MESVHNSDGGKVEKWKKSLAGNLKFEKLKKFKEKSREFRSEVYRKGTSGR